MIKNKLIIIRYIYFEYKGPFFLTCKFGSAFFGWLRRRKKGNPILVIHFSSALFLTLYIIVLWNRPLPSAYFGILLFVSS